MPYYPELLPLRSVDFETKAILRQLPGARAALAELKGIAATIPNVSILINALALQEAKNSSAIENIITTHDELFKAELDIGFVKNIAAKEVQNYALALKKGFDLVRGNKLITNSTILNIHQELEQNNAGYRVLPGTELKNERSNETIYVPPQNGDELKKLMSNLVDFLNDDGIQDIDPLVKMAIIHHQFESIHPFYDGNGRTGRILNILYLVAKGLLDYPLLYLSRYIVQNKAEYYRLLQSVRESAAWEEWVLYMLEGVESVSRQGIELIRAIKQLMQDYKFYIRDNYKYYSQDLLNNLFRHPYTKIEFLQQELKVDRRTAAKYLNELAGDGRGILTKLKLGKSNYYVHNKLVELLISQDYNVQR